jgi:hypothetical protein
MRRSASVVAHVTGRPVLAAARPTTAPSLQSSDRHPSRSAAELQRVRSNAELALPGCVTVSTRVAPVSESIDWMILCSVVVVRSPATSCEPVPTSTATDTDRHRSAPPNSDHRISPDPPEAIPRALPVPRPIQIWRSTGP